MLYRHRKQDMATNVELIRCDKHYMSLTSQQIKAISSPLKQFGITFFDHFRIYDDNSAIDLTTSPEFCDFFAKNKLYEFGGAGNYNEYLDGYYFWDTLVGASPVFTAIEEQCHVGHGLTIVKAYETHCDHFYLAGPLDKPEIKNFFISHKEFLDKFINYYYQEAESIIAGARPHSYIFPDNKRERDEMFQASQYNLPALTNLDLTVANHYALTSRELECIYHASYGLPTKSIAYNLNISQKTVQRHLETARDKTSTNNMIALLNKLGLIKH